MKKQGKKRKKLYEFLLGLRKEKRFVPTSIIFKWGALNNYTSACRRVREFANIKKSVIRRATLQETKKWQKENYKLNENLYFLSNANNVKGYDAL